jgi:beta-lactamase class A
MNLLALTLVSFLASTPASDSKAVEQAQAEVEHLISASGAEVAVAFRTLDTEMEILIRPDDVFHAASTMKVPVMMELFGQAEAGKLSLDASLQVTNEFHSIVDGSLYRLDPADDSDAELYQALGQEKTLHELCRRMITVSSNLAANLLIERLGPENIQRRVEALGAPGMKVLRGVEDGKAYDRGWNNTTTARALLTLLEKLTKGEVAGPEASREMIEILRRQEFNDAIPSGLPPGTPVAHKTGEITRIHHDAAIVYGDRPFVLVLLVRGLEDRTRTASLMAAITRVLWRAVHSKD